MKEPKDKRTKEYKDWLKLQNIEVDSKQATGLGDVIEKVTEVTGIKKIVEAFTPEGEDCGCKKRKETLNNLFPIRRKPIRCFTQEQYDKYSEYRKTRTLKTWHNHEIEFLLELYTHVFNVFYKREHLCANCNGAAKILLKITDELDKMYDTYKL